MSDVKPMAGREAMVLPIAYVFGADSEDSRRLVDTAHRHGFRGNAVINCQEVIDTFEAMDEKNEHAVSR